MHYENTSVQYTLILIVVQTENVCEINVEQLNFFNIFSRFYRRHFELISKLNVGLKTLLRMGLSEPENFMVTLFEKIRNLKEGMIFLFNSEKSLRVTDV